MLARGETGAARGPVIGSSGSQAGEGEGEGRVCAEELMRGETGVGVGAIRAGDGTDCRGNVAELPARDGRGLEHGNIRAGDAKEAARLCGVEAVAWGQEEGPLMSLTVDLVNCTK